jgi:predicted component of type VI protein secretion system
MDFRPTTSAGRSWVRAFLSVPLDRKHGHPEGLFAEMLALAGALTTFSLQVHPRDLAGYDHDNLGTCFGDLDRTLRLLLETVVPSNFVSLTLNGHPFTPRRWMRTSTSSTPRCTWP